MQISLAKKGQMVTGLIGIVIVLIVIIAIAFPLISSSISTTAAGSTIANTVNVVISNTNGTLNSTGANIFINKYVNTNYTVFNNVSKINLSATVPSTDFVKLYINGTATTTNYIKAKVTNDSYPINDSKAEYKITATSNATAIKNITYYLLISPKTKTVTSTVKPSPITLTILGFILVFLALAALLVVTKFIR
jgi:hypothetical protein